MRINTSHFNLAYEGQIDSIEAELRNRDLSLLNYRPSVVRDRLMQRIIELSLKFYAIETYRQSGLGKIKFPEAGSRLHCDRIELTIGGGQIRMTPIQWVINQRDFFLHWLYCFSMIIGVRRGGRKMDSSVLVYGVGEEALFQGRNDDRFSAYCSKSPVTALREGKTLVIQTRKEGLKSSRDKILYASNPLIYILRCSYLSFAGRINMMAKHMALFFDYIQIVMRVPLVSIIGRDIAYVAIARELNRLGQINSIVLTASNLSSQPLWMRGLSEAKTQMVWYSQNSKSTIYKTDSLQTNPPFTKWIRVDMHWVWTRAFAEYLTNTIHGASANVVGPIVWQLPQFREPPEDVISIVVFDVSPYADNLALEDGNITNHGSSENVILFISDVVDLKAQIELHFGRVVRISLKTKRGYRDGYQKSYFEYLENLERNGLIDLIDPQENIYSVISANHLVISYPFTSVNYISDLLIVPSIHYDPTGEICKDDSGDFPSLIQFVDSSEELREVAIAALSHTFSSAS